MKRVLIPLLAAGCLASAWGGSTGLGPRTGAAENPRIQARVLAAGRPRLFLSGDRLERLRGQIQGTHAALWQALRSAVDGMRDTPPPPYVEPRLGGDSTRPGTLNDEMLWQRQYGYVLPGMALVALLDPNPDTFGLVRQWALAPGKYPLWGAGLFENTGLAAKHQLFGLAIAYDWLYDRWSETDRLALRQTLREHGRILYEAAADINDRGWWKDTWKQNHAWNGYQALAVTAIALMGEEPQAETWLLKALWGGRHIIEALPDEGAYEEGLPYWGYGMEALLRFVEAVRPYADQDFYAFPYFANTYRFRLYLAGPDVGQIANFGDGRTTDWHALATTLHRLASQYQNPVAQWLADALPPRSDVDATCWNLLWYDADLRPALPPDLARSHVFVQTGFAGARTDWTPNAVTLHLRSGAADVSHSHLDVNNFLVNVAGEWLIRDYGYGEVGPGYFNKETIYFSTGTLGHNCLVIDGRHQRREADSVGHITAAEDTGGLVWWQADATACYSGALSVIRDLMLVRPAAGSNDFGFVVIRDRARTRQAATFDFMLQPQGRLTIDGPRFVIEGDEWAIFGTVLHPAEVSLSLSTGLGEPHLNVESPLSLRIRATGNSNQAEFLVVLQPYPKTSLPPTLVPEPDGLRIGDTRLRFPSDPGSSPRLERLP